ncbi:TonB-dependent receptor protein [Aliarcobacter butzleri RM4018]|uniref:TonB-dependent receptor protein n=2 Tax=Aliarcobacter butzleri TaxID=28197 RepID=A8EWQ4_ALIB4|nr:TonB-dependent siderophore receptor [Aliarcobacter butzleri]ABV68377.1 TonB-dependent receptor protein [Aliarcobacter butzleri RM4018]GGT79934.1 ligand-gated channel [Aliarcobacter butzleri]
MMHLKAKIITSASAILLCGSLFAQDVYTVKNMSLKQALEKISKESKLAYIVDESLISGKTAPNIENVQGLKNALNQVLKGSGLEATIEKGTIIIEKIVGQGTVLETISVNEGYSNGSAENGYVTKEISGVGLWDRRSLQDTPYQMSVVSQDMLENSASGVDQIFKMNPVVQVTRSSTSSHSWNTPEINIRGFSASGNHILDGIPFSWVEGIMPEELERMEVLNGLSGFLYGVGYVGGSTNYVTKKPTLERLTNVTVGTTGNEAAYAHIDLGGKIDEKGKFTYRLNALKQDGETSIKDQNIDRELITGALDWRATDNLILSFDASHKKTRIDKLTASFSSNQSINNLDPKQGYAPDWTYSDASQDRLGFKSLWQINDNVKLRTGYIHLDHENDMNMPYVYDNYDGTYRLNYYRTWPHTSTTQGAYVYTDIDFDTFGVEHTLTIGGSGNKTKSKSIDGAYEWDLVGNYTLNELNNALEPIYRGSSDNKKYVSGRNEKTNLMIGDDIRFNDQWSALVGFNYAKTEEKNYNINGDRTGGYDADEVTPSVSLIFKPFEDLTTYVTYMESLENGLKVECANCNNNGSVLDPYVSKQYEAGAKYSVSENLLLSSALFRIEKANRYDKDLPSGMKEVTQDGLEIHEGLELTATGKVTDNLTIVGGGTIMNLEIDKAASNEGKKPTDTASKMAKLYAEYDISAVKGLTLTGGAYYTGESYRDGANTDVIPSYTVYDGGLRYKTKLDKYPTTFIMNVTNLTDKKYWRSSTSFGEPRNLAFSMKMEF